MSVITSGPTPTPWLVNLATGQGLSQAWGYYPNGPTQAVAAWPTGASGYAYLSYTAPGSSSPTFTATWTATIDGSLLYVTEPHTVTDLVPDGALIELFLDPNDGNGPQLAMSGSVVRRL